MLLSSYTTDARDNPYPVVTLVHFLQRLFNVLFMHVNMVLDDVARFYESRSFHFDLECWLLTERAFPNLKVFAR